MELKAIETQYNGYRFRSRLEARWAVFFDTLGIAYEYEKEGYDLGEAGWYLPDFWLPEQSAWVEIKGQAPSEREKQCILSLERIGGCDIPGECPHEDMSPLLCDTKQSNCPHDHPRIDVYLMQGEPYFDEALSVPAFKVWTVGYRWPETTILECANTGHSGIIQCWVCKRIIFDSSFSTYYGSHRSNGYYCPACDGWDRRTSGPEYDVADCEFIKGYIYAPIDPRLTPLLTQAYRAARQARFEHGEAVAR